MANQVYARPALLITHTRSGGTMLNYALSTHQRIFWIRGEPLLRKMEWGKSFPDSHDDRILDCITRASFYTVAGCKVTYEQMSNRVIVWMRRRNNLRVLHLIRPNLLRVAVSQILTGMVVTQQLKDHRAHSFDVLDTPKVTLNPSAILSRIISQEAAIAKKRELLKELGHEVLELTYDDLVGKEGNEVDRLPDLTAEKICTFLGVRYEHLAVDLRRVNRAPLSEMIENWADVKKHIGATKYKNWLKEED